MNYENTLLNYNLFGFAAILVGIFCSMSHLGNNLRQGQSTDMKRQFTGEVNILLWI